MLPPGFPAYYINPIKQQILGLANSGQGRLQNVNVVLKVLMKTTILSILLKYFRMAEFKSRLSLTTPGTTNHLNRNLCQAMWVFQSKNSLRNFCFQVDNTEKVGKGDQNMNLAQKVNDKEVD